LIYQLAFQFFQWNIIQHNENDVNGLDAERIDEAKKMLIRGQQANPTLSNTEAPDDDDDDDDDYDDDDDMKATASVAIKSSYSAKNRSGRTNLCRC
jgi:hypothetical protein